jgi:hypothetical protein
MNNTIISLIRTYVPIGVGVLISWLATRGIHVDDNTKLGLVSLLTGLVTAGYYTLVRIGEKKYPWLGVLLGHKTAPIYVKPADPPAPAENPNMTVVPPKAN